MGRVEFQGVTKCYPDRRSTVTAVDRLDLSIRDGELLAIVGPSGCGKTTTLRLVAGLEEVSGGDIRIGERVVNRVPPKDRDVAMVFQNYALYPHMSVYDNMTFGLKMRATPKADIQRKVTETARRLSIEPLLHRKPGALSGGEQQRVALARAIVRRPNVFLFDEPLSNLDVSLRLQMRSEIKTLHRELGITTIHVTHDQEEAMILGDRIAVMRGGKLQQCAPPMEVYEQPANLFVAGFIGSPPMNFLRGRLRAEGAEWVFEGTIGCVPLPRSSVPEAQRRVLDRADGEVILGTRPEQIATVHDGSSSTGPFFPIRAHVTLIEPLGDRLHVHLSLPSGETLVAKTSAHARFAVNEIVEFRLDLSRAHVFPAT